MTAKPGGGDRKGLVVTMRRMAALCAVTLAALAAGCGDSTVATTAAVDTSTSAPTTLAPATTAPPPSTTVPATTTSPVGAEVDADTAAAVQSAVAASSEVETGRLEGSFVITGIEGAPSGTDVEFTFSGAFDSSVPAMTFVMDLSAIAAAAGDDVPPGFEDAFSEMEMRQIGDVSYLRFAFLNEFLGVPTEWVSFPAGSNNPAESFVAGTPGNPGDLLGAFADSGARVLDAGPDPIRGFDTTHYVLLFDVTELTANADPEDLAALEELGPLGLDEFALDAWIDPEGRLHRFEMSFDGGDTGDGATGTSFERATMRFDIRDHGAPVGIEAPPPDQVTDGEGLDLSG